MVPVALLAPMATMMKLPGVVLDANFTLLVPGLYWLTDVVAWIREM
jgi:hypothetical protein